METEFTIDGQSLPENSRIGELACPGSRLQDWIEDLPSILIEECNDNNFDITFHGTSADYEDLAEVLTQAYQRKELEASLQRIAAKETTDKEALIDEVFYDTIRGGLHIKGKETLPQKTLRILKRFKRMWHYRNLATEKYPVMIWNSFAFSSYIHRKVSI